MNFWLAVQLGPAKLFWWPSVSDEYREFAGLNRAMIVGFIQAHLEVLISNPSTTPV